MDINDFLPDGKYAAVTQVLTLVLTTALAALAAWLRGKGIKYATGLRIVTDAIEAHTFSKAGIKNPVVEDIKGTIQIAAAAVPPVEAVVTYTAAESQSAAQLATAGTYKQGQDKQDVKDHP